MQVEQVFAECTANGLLFKHFQQRQLEGAEVELFVNSPDFKTARDDKTYTLSAVPKAGYKMHNLSEKEIAIVFSEDMLPLVKGLKVEVRIYPYDEESSVMLNRNLKASLKEITRNMQDLKRTLKKVEFKQRAARIQKKVVRHESKVGG
jgi:hypothetical protein